MMGPSVQPALPVDSRKRQAEANACSQLKGRDVGRTPPRHDSAYRWRRTAEAIRPSGCCVPATGGYTSGMKTAISIPDDLFDDAERLARALNKSRSRLYGDAVREYVARHSADQITETLDQVLDVATSGDRDFVTGAARRVLERSDW